MNLLFYHTAERVFHDPEGGLYTSGNFTPEVWERYLSVCDHLAILMRDSGVVLDKDIALSTKQKIDTTQIKVFLITDSYQSMKDYLSVKGKKERATIISKAFAWSDCAIFRPSNESGIKMYRKIGKPYAVEVVGCPWDAFWNHGIKGKVLAPYMYLYSKAEVSKAKWVLYVTNNFLQRRYPTKGHTVNCSNVSLKMPQASVLDRRLKKINDSNSRLVLGTAAALDVRYKGQEYVIRALAKLKQQGLTNFEYQLIGGGDQTYLLQLAQKCGVSDQVKIIGQLSHDRVFSWLEQVDIYIQPSLQEGLPRAVIEAMSYGIPCMGTRVAGIPELIAEDMLFKGKDVNGIVSILKKISKQRMLELAKENFEGAKVYDVEVLKERRHVFYRDFMADAEKRMNS